MKTLLISTALTLAHLSAAELTIKTGVFETSLEFEATLLPAEAIAFRLEPEQWSGFIVAGLAGHGMTVKKDEIVVSFEKDEYLRQVIEQEKGVDAGRIALEKAKRELIALELTTPRTIEGLRLAHERAEEALAYFEETGKDLEIESAKRSLENAQRSLSYQQEELDQLQKMYDEDGETEETEEIILTRQKAAVESAKFSLHKMELATKWTIDKTIPRKEVDLKREHDQALTDYETGKENLPRELAEKTLSVEKLERGHEKATQDLADLKADTAFFSLKAPVDGTIYHGEFKDGSWALGDAPKYLFESGTAPVKKTLMSLVPSDSPLTLHGNLAQKDYLSLSNEATGEATIEGLPGSSFPVTVTSIDRAPGTSGTYGLKLAIDLPAGSPVVAGMKTKVNLTTYFNQATISVPDRAIEVVDGKPTVKLKMADGKLEAREIKTGRKSKGRTEILEGLEPDQVIFVPAEAQ